MKLSTQQRGCTLILRARVCLTASRVYGEPADANRHVQQLTPRMPGSTPEAMLCARLLSSRCTRAGPDWFNQLGGLAGAGGVGAGAGSAAAAAAMWAAARRGLSSCSTRRAPAGAGRRRVVASAQGLAVSIAVGAGIRPSDAMWASADCRVALDGCNAS